MRKSSGTLLPSRKNTESAMPILISSRRRTIQSNSDDDKPPSDHFDLAEWIMIFLFLLICCVWIIGKILGYIEDPGIWVYYLMFSLLAIIHIEQAVANFFIKNYFSSKELKWKARIDAMMRWQWFFLPLICVFYMFRLDKIIYRHAVDFLPLTETLRKVLSEIILWIMSGIIGNFAYDILKKLTRKTSLPDLKNAD